VSFLICYLERQIRPPDSQGHVTTAPQIPPSRSSQLSSKPCIVITLIQSPPRRRITRSDLIVLAEFWRSRRPLLCDFRACSETSATRATAVIKFRLVPTKRACALSAASFAGTLGACRRDLLVLAACWRVRDCLAAKLVFFVCTATTISPAP
jgi:hypothetical protein